MMHKGSFIMGEKETHKRKDKGKKTFKYTENKE